MSSSHRDTPQFGSEQPGGSGSFHDFVPCAACEALLTDVLDGTLSLEDQERFDRHMASCTACSEMLADAQRGAAWLDLLRDPRPEPPLMLVERILQRTQAEAAHPISLAPATPVGGMRYPAVPMAARSNLYVFPAGSKFTLRLLQQTLLQPRLAMTAAMAFFSIGLTLNMTGVQLNQIHANDLRPSHLRRSLYQANASVIRYYDNLRVVYELESRVRELERSNDAEPAKEREAEPKSKHPAPRPGTGSSHQQIHSTNAVPPSLALLQQRSTRSTGFNRIKEGDLA